VLLSEKVDAVNIGSMCHKGEGQYGPQIMTSSARPPPNKSPKHFFTKLSVLLELGNGPLLKLFFFQTNKWFLKILVIAKNV